MERQLRERERGGASAEREERSVSWERERGGASAGREGRSVS